MPAAARLDKRQSVFATKLASVQSGPHSNIVRGQTTGGKRPGRALGPIADIEGVEKSVLGQGRTFPGVYIPPLVLKGKEEEKERRIEKTAEEARKFDRDVYTIWTDGSRIDPQGEGLGGVVAWYEEVSRVDSPPPPLFFARRGVLGLSTRKDETAHAHTYRDGQRSFRQARLGWRGVGFSMDRGREA